MVINLAYIMNKKYEKWFTISLHSIMRYNKEINLYLYSDDLDSLEIKKKQFTRIYPKLNIQIIKDERIKEWVSWFDEKTRGYGHVSKEGFIRLFLPNILPDVDKIIYLDCDIVNKANLNKLWNTDMEGKSFLGCRGWTFSDTQAKELNIPYYVLSGMLVMDLARLRSIDSLSIIKENYKQSLLKPAVPSADETLLNDLFFNEIKLVPETWNYCYDREYGTRSVPKQNVNNWHVCGPNKSKMVELYVYE